MGERDPEEPTWPKPGKRRPAREHAWKWAPLVTALTALATGVTGYIDNAKTANEAHAKNQVRLEAAYKSTREALVRVEAVEAEHAREIVALREAVAELRGAMEVLGRAKPSVTGAAERAARALEGAGAMSSAPAPTSQLPETLPEPTKAEVAEKLKAK